MSRQTGEANVETDLQQWRTARPALSGHLDGDARMLTGYVSAGEQLLARFPARPARMPSQHDEVVAVLCTVRDLRAQFLDLHAEAIYEILTAGRRQYLDVAELLVATATRFPGLVPSPAQMRHEESLAQADKDGLAIDQALFLRAILRAPGPGSHLLDAMLLPSVRAQELLPELRRQGRLRFPTVSLERRGRAAHVTINNPTCLNAEDDQLLEDLGLAVDITLLDDSVAVGVLRGGVMCHPRYHGRRVFSAGINLRALGEGRISFVDFLIRRELGFISKIRNGLLADPWTPDVGPRTVQKPWVAVVDTFAIGGGMQILLVMDRVIATDGCFFSLPAANEGIVPGAANLRLHRLTGGRLARRMILGGHVIRATDPEAALVCDEVVPPEGMDGAIAAAVEQLDNPAVVANRGMLNLAEEPADAFRTYMAEFALAQAVRIHDHDVLAKLERAWSGRRRAAAASE